MSDYVLPSKVYAYLRQFLLNYEHGPPCELAAIVKHGCVAVDIEKIHDYSYGEHTFGC